MSIELKTVTGTALQQYVPALAQLRIQVFHDFPYLYDGNLEYEQHYLQVYQHSPDAAVIIALDNEVVIGASTCIPMRDEDKAIQQPFLTSDNHIPIERLFYCGESVLDKRYRGQGIGVAFFQYREAHAAKLGGFSHACFCAVNRPLDHPLRPQHYQPLDHFWQKRGYQKQAHLQAEFAWKDIDQAQETTKTLTFWLKALGENT